MWLQDFHPLDGNRFMSSGMDNTVKIWSLEGKAPCVLLLHQGHVHAGMPGATHSCKNVHRVLCMLLRSGLQDILDSSFDHEVDGDTVFDTKQLACPKFSSHKVCQHPAAPQD